MILINIAFEKEHSSSPVKKAEKRSSVNLFTTSGVNTRRIVYTGLLIGLTVILRRYLNFQLSLIAFGGFPVILAGILFGPFYGAWVGGASDILGYFLNSFGLPYHPGFTLTAALDGFIPPFILLLIYKKNQKIPSFFSLTLAIFAGQFITGVILVPYFYSQLAGKAFMIIKFAEGLITQIIHAPLYAFFIIKILKVYENSNK